MNTPRYLMVAATLFVAASRSFSAGTPEAASAVKETVSHFQEAWNRHDIDALSTLMAEDVVFIHSGAGRLNSRQEFKDHHVQLHKVVMAQSVLSTKSVDVKFMTPDLAVVHWEWALQGDRNQDGSARLPREGIFTWLLERRGTSWLIVESQNTNKAPPR